MVIIKCKMCGGDLNITDGMTVAECEYCGTKQTVPSVDNEKKVTLFGRANRLRLSCEFDKASSVYESIVAEFPEEAEAYWGLVLCKFGIEYVDDPATGKKIPTCHRSSFESVMEDSDFEQACENADAVARKVYRDEAKTIEEIRKGIIEVSGKEQPYDIFICYKETDENGERTIDSVLAQDIYDALTEKGYRVFFSRVTLEDKLGQEYEPYIFAALNSAKIMLAFGTDYEYFNAVWVKNEWSRFLKLMAADKNKHLIPCYKGIDAYDMPKEFAKLQAQDLGKVGATQDLLRGIEKILGGNSAQATADKETVVVQNVGGTNIDALLKRGNMCLEDGEWSKANEYFDRVLDTNAECAEAYLGKALASWQVSTLERYMDHQLSATARAETNRCIAGTDDEESVKQIANKYAISGYVTENQIEKLLKGFDWSYDSTLACREKQREEEKNNFANNKNLSRAFQFATGDVKVMLDTSKENYFAKLDKRVAVAQQADKKTIAQRKADYVKFLDEKEAEAEKMSRAAYDMYEKNYQRACGLQEKAECEGDYMIAFDTFKLMGDYKDCKSRAEACKKEIERIEEEQKKEQRKKDELFAQEEAVREKKRSIIDIIVVAIVVAVVIVAVFAIKVVIPNTHYSAAEKLLENGDYDAAIEAFTALNGYKDSEELIQVAKEQVLAIKYAEAESLLESGDNASAALAFGKIGYYEDAQSRSMEVWGNVTQRDTISAGGAHTVGLKSDGTVVAVGDNKYGQCDISDWTDIIAISAGGDHTVGLKSDGTVVAVGGGSSGQCDVSDWTSIVAISAGGLHTVGLKSDGTVVAVGDNTSCQCDVSDWADIIAISAGEAHTVGLKSDGTVVATGNNEEGQCDVYNWTDIVAISAGYNHTVGLKSNGTVVAVGSNDYSQCDVSGWTDIVEIVAGHHYTAGLKSNGTAVAVGYNKSGQCDLSDWTDIVAVSVGDYYTVGLKSDGTVVAVGVNISGRCDVSDWIDIKVNN